MYFIASNLIAVVIDIPIIDAFDDGSIKIDASQLSIVDMVLVDGEEWDDAYVHGNMVKVYFLAGAEKIEIIGN